MPERIRRATRRVRDRPTGWLEASSAAWTAGEAVYLVGLVVYAYRLGGAPAVGFVALLQSLPSVVLAPAAMNVARRIPRGRLLRSVLVVRVAAVGLLAVAVAVAAPVALVYGLAAVDAVGSTLLRPIRSSLIPMVARSPAELVSANVAVTTGMSAAGLLGPAAAAVFLAFGGVEPTFVAGTMLFVVAFVLAGRQRIARESVAPRAWDPAGVEGPAEVLAGLGAARLVIATIVGQRFVRGMLSVLVVATAVDLLGAGDEAVGILMAAIGLGGLIGSVASMHLIGRRRLGGAFSGAVAVWGLGLAAPGVAPVLVLAVAFMALSGGAKAVLEVAGVSLLQRTVPAARMGRVLTLLESLVTLSLATGAIAASLLVEYLGPATALLVAGGSMVALAVLTRPAMRAADDASVVPERELALLRGVAFFRPLQLTTIERLAAALERVPAPAGTEVIRQGGVGDRFYIVESGRLRTSIGGEHIRDLGPGDAFGEIALLRSVPRTATVSAVDDSVLVALGREEFLAAVSGHDQSIAAADAVVRARVGP